MVKTAIIVTYVNEYPTVMFTLRSLIEECRGMDVDIMAVDNMPDPPQPDHPPDLSHQSEKGGPGCVEAASKLGEFRYLKYNETLSHWSAKGWAVNQTDADIFVFIDAHCVPTYGCLSSAIRYYEENCTALKGTLHLPLSYQILETHRLAYNLVYDEAEMKVAYTFCGFPKFNGPVKEVPCGSNCGCIMSREVYNAFGGYPENMGPYSGGEHMFNFTLATLGYKHWISNFGCLHHHGARRGYRATGDQILYNQLMAVYFYGGEKRMRDKGALHRGNPGIIDVMCNYIVEGNHEQRAMIKANQVIDIDTWAKGWTNERS